MRRHIAIGVIVGAVLISGAGVAVAGVSDGNYDPARQNCSGNANDTEREDIAEEGCQNLTGNVNDGNGNEVARVGLPQLRDGENPNPAAATYEANPDGFDPSTGTHAYFGADDNLNSGEHDGSDQVGDGPSDGGAIVLNVEPNSLAEWLNALAAGDTQYVLTHPIPLVDFGAGACADGVCVSTQSERRRAYDGGSTTAPDRDAANYDGYTWDPDTCSGADSTEADCGPGGLAYWHAQSGDVYVNPGVQVYEDPSPAGSPLGPYPLPGVYAGTCGVVYSPTMGSATVIPTGC